MTASTLILLAAAVASAAPKPEVRNVRIYTPKLFVSRAKSDSDALVTGQFRVDMSFARAPLRRDPSFALGQSAR